MGTPEIRFEAVSKRYSLGSGPTSMRSALAALPRRLLRAAGASEPPGLWALRDVSFEAGAKEVLGIVGPNGAGKTTILKLLSKVTFPTSGRITTRGRISSLIELGAGFHPELTGRENILLNGVILGLSRREIRSRFDQIVQFAGLKQFLDTPVKRYSSGMWARLGFAVAAHVEPDILLVDEVLSVGDASFQYRCFERMRELVSQQRTVVLVSHNLDAVQQLCHRVLWLDRGVLRGLGRPEEVLRAYLDQVDNERLKQSTSIQSETALRILRVLAGPGDASDSRLLEPGQDLTVRLEYSAEERIARPYFTLGVAEARAGALFVASMLADGEAPASIQGRGSMTCCFASPPLAPGVYDLWGEVRDEHGYAKIVPWQQIGSFRVVDSASGTRPGDARPSSVAHERTYVPIRVPHRWEHTAEGACQSAPRAECPPSAL